MFERFSEKARRTIFFARYEAVQFGSPCIDTEHLLLGLLREYRGLPELLPPEAREEIRAKIASGTQVRKNIPTPVDLPLTNKTKRALNYAADEATRLNHKWIGPEHLLLGLLREKEGLAAQILQSRGLDIDKLREHFAKNLYQPPPPNPPRRRRDHTVDIHGFAWHAETIRQRVSELRTFNWHWHKTSWKPRDVAVDSEGKISFDLTLLEDKQNFTRSPGAWKKDRCTICGWELCDSADNPGHGAAYTNGRDWVCEECYEKFLKGPDYFESPHSDIT
jgi:ATP-dependent Clp protease ATP-binding subunit ClpA